MVNMLTNEYTELNAISPVKCIPNTINIDGVVYDITPSNFSSDYFLRSFDFKLWLYKYRLKNGMHCLGTDFDKVPQSDLEYPMEEIIQNWPEGLV